jgi:hypothetical protein
MTNHQRERLWQIAHQTTDLPVNDRLAIRVLLDEHGLLVQENGRLRAAMDAQGAVLDLRSQRGDGLHEHCVEVYRLGAGWEKILVEWDRMKNEAGWDLITYHTGTHSVSRLVGGAAPEPVLVCVFRRPRRPTAADGQAEDSPGGSLKMGPPRRTECGK